MIDILVFSHSCFRAINRSVYQVLLQKGVKVEVIAPKFIWESDGNKIEAEPVSEADPPMHFLELTHHQSKSRIYQFKGAGRILDKTKPKVIFCENDPVSFMAYRLGKWAKKNDCTLICLSCENLRIDPVSLIRRLGIKDIPATLLKTLILFRARPLVHHVLTINNAGTKVFRDLGYRQVTKTPLGFNPEIFFPSDENRKAIRSDLSIDDKSVVFAYIGRMVPEKGLHVLFESLGKLLVYDWHLLLDRFEAKEDAYLKKLETIIEETGIKNRIKYFEASHLEVAKYINAADVIVMPSVSSPRWVEQYGRVAPESMACGKLVVASDTGALPELIGDCGILVKENSVDDLRKALQDYLEDPEKFEEYGKKAAARARQHLSIHSQAGVMEELINTYN